LLLVGWRIVSALSGKKGLFVCLSGVVCSRWGSTGLVLLEYYCLWVAMVLAIFYFATKCGEKIRRLFNADPIV